MDVTLRLNPAPLSSIVGPVRGRTSKTDGRVLRAKALREERRLQILAAAARVFAKQGYELGSIADIIDEAGIARGTFYLHFESKQQIFAELVDDLLAELDGAIKRVEVGSEVPPVVQLVDNLARVFDVLVANAAVTNILLSGTPRGETEQRIARFFEQCIELIGSSLETGRELGLVRAVDHQVVAHAVLGGMKEVVSRLLLERALGPAERRALAEKVLDIHLHGALAGGER